MLQGASSEDNSTLPLNSFNVVVPVPLQVRHLLEVSKKARMMIVDMADKIIINKATFIFFYFWLEGSTRFELVYDIRQNLCHVFELIIDIQLYMAHNYSYAPVTIGIQNVRTSLLNPISKSIIRTQPIKLRSLLILQSVFRRPKW